MYLVGIFPCCLVAKPSLVFWWAWRAIDVDSPTVVGLGPCSQIISILLFHVSVVCCEAWGIIDTV